jgi:hypothetical protein
MPTAVFRFIASKSDSRQARDGQEALEHSREWARILPKMFGTAIRPEGVLQCVRTGEDSKITLILDSGLRLFNAESTGSGEPDNA